jgi:hypothetical protein
VFISQDKPAEQKRIVEFLARGSEVPIAEIARLYALEEIALEAASRVKKFVPVFLIRNVRAQLRQIGIGGPARPSAAAADIQK